LLSEVQESRRKGFADEVAGTSFGSADEVAGTSIRCRLWCGGMRRRGLLLAALVGVVVATVGALAFGWLITVSIPLGVGVALVADLLIWRSQRAALRRRVEAYLSDLEHLDRERPQTG
jgi:hypothetical protein